MTTPTRHRYRGIYNIHGQVIELWGWYDNDAEAARKLKRKLDKEVGRMVFLDGVDNEVVRVDPVSVKQTP